MTEFTHNAWEVKMTVVYSGKESLPLLGTYYTSHIPSRDDIIVINNVKYQVSEVRYIYEGESLSEVMLHAYLYS